MINVNKYGVGLDMVHLCDGKEPGTQSCMSVAAFSILRRLTDKTNFWFLESS